MWRAGQPAGMDGQWNEGPAHNEDNTLTPVTEIIVSQVLPADLGLDHEWPSPRPPTGTGPERVSEGCRQRD